MHDGTSPSAAPAPYSDPGVDEAPAKPSLRVPLLASTVPYGMRNDLNDADADAICAVRFTGAHSGAWTADSAFGVWGEANLGAHIAPGQLDLDWGWWGYASENEKGRYLEESRITLSFVPDAASAFTPGALLGDLYRTEARRACDRDGGRAEPVAPSSSLGRAKLDVLRRSSIVIEGVMTLGEGTREEERLTFTAPFGAPRRDDSVCCLKGRPYPSPPPSTDPPKPPMTAEELAALCKQRDDAPPVGTYQADPELHLDGYFEVDVSETMTDRIDGSGKHDYSSSLELLFRQKPTKDMEKKSEYEAFEGWYLSRSSQTELPRPFDVGRHERLSFGGYSGGSSCGAGFSGGGSGTFSTDTRVTLVIESRTDEIIEGTIGVPVSGKVAKVHFQTQLHPPPRPSLCCYPQ